LAGIDDHAAQVRPRLAAAVRRLVHHLVGALAQIDRLQHVEVERVLDVAPGVPRRQRDVDDDRVLRIVRLHLAERLADDLFVLPDASVRDWNAWLRYSTTDD